MNSGYQCPDCGWEEKPHSTYGWQKHNEHAVEVHRTQLCPSLSLLERVYDTDLFSYTSSCEVCGKSLPSHTWVDLDRQGVVVACSNPLP